FRSRPSTARSRSPPGTTTSGATPTVSPISSAWSASRSEVPRALRAHSSIRRARPGNVERVPGPGPQHIPHTATPGGVHPMAVSTLSDLLYAGVADRKILVRSDLTFPLDASTITSAGRITASLPTLDSLLDAGAALVITAHLGRPEGTSDPEFSLAPVAEKLGDELGRYVQLAGDVVGPDARERANGLTDGDVL